MWAEDQAGTIEAVRLELETARAQLGLVLANAATVRGQIGVTARQLLIELGYTEAEATLMLGDKADQPPPAPTKGGATAVGAAEQGQPRAATALTAARPCRRPAQPHRRTELRLRKNLRTRPLALGGR